MPIIDVGCAVISRGGKILIAQRKPGEFLSGFWEFPGGKREKGETIEDCLAREVYEELWIRIRPRQWLGITEHAYPGRTFRLHFYACDWISGRPVKRDCLDFRWVFPFEMRRFCFPPGDERLIDELSRRAGWPALHIF